MSRFPATRSLLRSLALAYLFLGLFWLASARVAQENALWLLGATFVLAIPPMLALWHQATVRRLVLLHQFAAGSALRWWGGRRALSFALRAVVALALSMVALLQSPLFGPVEWWLIGAAPVLFVCVRMLVGAATRSQFVSPAYGLRWTFRASQFAVIALLFVAWVVARSMSAELPALPFADRVHQLQVAWKDAPSGIVRWALDAGAWGQAGAETLGSLRSDASWRLMAALVIAPLGVLGHVALSLAGLSLPASEIRRTLGSGLTADAQPPPVGPVRAALLSAIGVIVAVVVFQVGGMADSLMRTHPSPLAVTPLPECDRIGEQFYRVGTLQLLEAERVQFADAVRRHTQTACVALSSIAEKVEPGIDRYLDWYFSLGAEWLRLAAMLTGDLDALLKNKLAETIGSNHEAQRLLERAERERRQLESVQVSQARKRIGELLEANRLVIGPGSCKVVEQVAANPLALQLDEIESRVKWSSGVAVSFGAFAGIVAAKAMTKTSMKTAAKLLAKLAAKKAATQAAGAATGAVIGSVVLPGIGTAAGAVVGGAVGLGVSIGVDLAVLAVEEQLTREDMKKDIQAAVTESLVPYRQAFGCE